MRKPPYAWQPAVMTVCFAAFMSQLDASIVTLTYPSLEREFDAPLATVQWVSLDYLLVLTAVMVTVGHHSDLLGSKHVYLYGFGIFTLAAPRDRLRGALGVQAAGQALGLALGPPLGVIAIILGRYLLPRTTERATDTRFDLPGTAWLTTAVTLLLGGVSVFSDSPHRAGRARR